MSSHSVEPVAAGKERATDDDADAEVEWEISEGIPQPSDAVVEKYFQGREALIMQEDKHRSDLDFRQLLSPMAQEASAIVGSLRFEEEDTIWDRDSSFRPYSDVRPTPEVHPGMMFGRAKPKLEQTKLFQIVKKMPKGCVLHCHTEAMLEYDWLFEHMLSVDGMHIAAAKPLLNAQDREHVSVELCFTKAQSKPDESLWSDSYTPRARVPVTKAAETFPDGGRDGFVKWLTSRCTVSTEESLNHQNGQNAVWRKFLDCFMTLRSLVYYEPVFHAYIRRVLEQLAEDNVRYIEIRNPSPGKWRPEGQEEDLPDEEGWRAVFSALDQEIKKFQATEAGKNFWGLRIIWVTLRALDNREILRSMKGCILIKQEFPELIAGFDLVGQEDRGRPLADLLPTLLWFKKACAQAGVNIPYFFHAGETTGSGTHTDMNLFDALLLGTRRIGHGFSLYKHPLLMNMVRDRRICVECCPISNEILRLTTSAESHPLPALLANGVAVALSNDDPGVLGVGHAGMSHDFYQVLAGIESLGLEGLGALAENSVRYASFEDEDNKSWIEGIKNGAYGAGLKARRLKEWKHDWEKFCQWVVMEFGVDVDLNPEE